MRLKVFLLSAFFGMFYQGAFADRFRLIDSIERLNDVCTTIQAKKYIAVDLEFENQRLCLLQVCWGKGDDDGALIDYIALEKKKPAKLRHALGSFSSILTNPAITKVFHAPSEDLKILHALTGKLAKSVVDTQAMYAAITPNYKAGYTLVVEDLLKRKVDKTQQCSSWSKRPLSEEQLSYATADVTHLFSLYPLLSEKLGELGRESFIQEYFKRTLTTIPSSKKNPRSNAQFKERTNNLMIQETVHASKDNIPNMNKFMTRLMGALKEKAEEFSMAQQMIATRSDIVEALNHNENSLMTDERAKFLGWKIKFLLEKYHENPSQTINWNGVMHSIEEKRS
jgi:ribonuclease D